MTNQYMLKLTRRLFYTGIIMISVFEVLNVFFIMPMPGSQEIKSIDIAYFLYTHRWHFRIVFFILIASGITSAFNKGLRALPVLSLLLAIVVISAFNFKMNAESMFRQPVKLVLKPWSENMLSDSSLLICVVNNGKAKGYPIRFMSYHHQVQDSIGDLSLIITYCNVCRTGRAYIPEVEGHPEKFRLVGMDHYNAMFEDATTGSWWRQATGEAIAGPMKGKVLPEYESIQLTAGKLFELYPDALVMQADEASRMKYDIAGKFERGKSTGRLTRTDSLSWKDKSWVVGIMKDQESKAYDWNLLKEQHIINDIVGNTPIVLALSADGKSFAAFERPDGSDIFTIRNDTLIGNGSIYNISGTDLSSRQDNLKRVSAYQEFWHSWRTFHPLTLQYQ
jgi:hypothetical protein